MKSLKSSYIVVFLFILLSAGSISAQSGECSGRSFDIWLNCEVARAAGARLNQQAGNKQEELPSIADNSTSLVDQTSAPDLLGIGLNLAGLSGESQDGKEKTSVSFTTSAYAVYATFLQKDPLDPAFYTRHPNLRRLYFTVGQETPETEDATETDRTTLLGVKYLIINRRDVSIPTNRGRLENLAPSLGAATRDFSGIARQVQDYLYSQLVSPQERAKVTVNLFLDQFDDFQALHDRLTPDQFNAIRALISDRIESRVVLERDTINTIEKIRKAPQLAFTFQSKLRKADGVDEYRTGLAFDYGLQNRINVILNGTFDYADSKVIGGDKRGGRVSGEANFKLNRDRAPFGGVGPYTFAVSGEGKWMNGDESTYTGQFKLTIPVSNGISFPISISFANRSELIKETTVRGRFGFSFDLAKLLNAVR